MGKQRSTDAATRKGAVNKGTPAAKSVLSDNYTVRRALLTPRVIMVDCNTVIRLMEGETVHVGACNVSLCPTPDVPKLRDVVRVQNRIRKEKMDAEKAAAIAAAMRL